MAVQYPGDGGGVLAAVPSDDALLLPAGAGEVAELLGLAVRLIYREGRGVCAAVELSVPPGSGHPPTHVHRRTEETFYIVAGTVAVQVGQDVHEAGPGTLVRVPPGVPHSFWNAGADPALIISTIAPAGVERFLLELGPRLAASDSSPEQGAAIRRELAARYDVEYPVL